MTAVTLHNYCSSDVLKQYLLFEACAKCVQDYFHMMQTEMSV